MSIFFISHYSDNSGSDIFWKTCKEVLYDGLTENPSSAEVISCLKSLGLKYEEHFVPNSTDISECFDPSSQIGEHLLSFMTSKDHFYKAFAPESTAGILDILRNKCCTEKDGRIFYNSDLNCILVYP